jgi:transposase
LLVLESKPSLYVSDNRGKDLQTSKVGQNSKQRFCKSFKPKIKKKTEKKSERKIEKS